MAFIDEYLVERGMSTQNELWSGKLAWTMLYAYIFIIQNIFEVGHNAPPPRGALLGESPQNIFHFLWPEIGLKYFT